MLADNTAYLSAAARQRSQDTLARAERVLAAAETSGHPITVAELVTQAQVSRAWVYSRPDLRERIELLRQQPRRRHRAPTDDRASRASLQRRLEIAHERLRLLAEENARLNEQLSRALGQQRRERRHETHPGS